MRTKPPQRTTSRSQLEQNLRNHFLPPFPREHHTTSQHAVVAEQQLDDARQKGSVETRQEQDVDTSGDPTQQGVGQHVRGVDPEKGTADDSSSDEVKFDEHDYPEGGLKAWMVTFGGWCAMVCGLGLLNTIGPLQAYLVTHQLQSYSESTVSWIFSIYVFLVFFCGLQIGPIFDAKGPRLLIFIGSVLTVLSIMLLGLCTGTCRVDE